MKSLILIALVGVASTKPGALDDETMSALAQQGKDFENEVLDAAPIDLLQLDMNVNNKILIDAQEKFASRDVPTSQLLMWDDSRTETELELDLEGDEGVKADVAYTDADLLAASK